MGPLRLYMHMAEQWQKTWADAMALWTKPDDEPPTPLIFDSPPGPSVGHFD
jgi:hypothetical protein